MPDPGVLYILSNDHIPGLVKVGKTARDAAERAKELRSTGVPGEYKVEWQSKRLATVTLAEREAHEALRRFREDREFFRISVADAQAILAEVERPYVDWVWLQAEGRHEGEVPKDGQTGIASSIAKAGARVLRLFVSTQGRITRQTWVGLFLLPGLLLGFALTARSSSSTDRGLLVISWGLMAWLQFVGFAKRLQDLGLPGRPIGLAISAGIVVVGQEAIRTGMAPWALAAVSGSGAVVVLLALLRRGQPWPNRHGEDPLGGRARGSLEPSLAGILEAFGAILALVTGVLLVVSKVLLLLAGSAPRDSYKKGGFGIATKGGSKGGSLSYLYSQRKGRRRKRWWEV